MKEITNKEYKRILVDILVYFDKICREHKIKYSLTGGSLIGAIREDGIIPWDDDIDVVMMPEEYKKFMSIMEKQKDDRYLLLKRGNATGYFYPFVKIVDTYTAAQEEHVCCADDYGIFLDIFALHYIPNNVIAAKLHYHKMNFLRTILALSMNDKKYKNPIKKAVAFTARTVGASKWGWLYERSLTREKPTNFVMHNWPTYGFQREMLSTKLFNNYIDHKFEEKNVMISQEYDAILTQVFGDYMTPPPEKDRKRHGIKAYWRERV